MITSDGQLVFNDGYNEVVTIEDIDGGDRNDFVIQYSTGFIDENGKEIYIGDIIQYGMCGAMQPINSQPYSLGSAYWKAYKEVRWESDIKSLGNYKGKEGVYQSDSIRIVGNIFENPELLEPTEFEKELQALFQKHKRMIPWGLV